MVAKNCVFLTVCAVIIAMVLCHPTKRQAEPEESLKTNEASCRGNTPCGWAVYNKPYRKIDYFMKNRCSCSSDSQCVRENDDISISAYVYRCKVKKS